MNVHQIKYTYLPCDYTQLKADAKNIIKLLLPHRRKFDSIVVCGSSGTIMAGILSLALKKSFLVCKKHYNKYGKTQGVIGKRYIIVDDFIEYGSTILGMLNQVKQLNLSFKPKCVAIYLYKIEISNMKDVFKSIPINSFKLPL
jgi:adenine/guanine phosphoribosyltransferase-like PRPP-binding protein